MMARSRELQVGAEAHLPRVTYGSNDFTRSKLWRSPSIPLSTKYRLRSCSLFSYPSSKVDVVGVMMTVGENRCAVCLLEPRSLYKQLPSSGNTLFEQVLG